jgi:putative DNA primase/helicase
VRLGPAGDFLGLAEGVETGLSAMQLSGETTWACLGASRMASIFVPGCVEFLQFFPDRDPAGRAAMAKAIGRHQASRDVRALIPPAPFDDWNSYLVATPPVEWQYEKAS